MVSIDKYAYQSRIATLSVAEKLWFGAVPLLLALSFSSFLLNFVIIAIMTVASVYWGNLAFKRYLYLLSIPVGFTLLGVITVMVTVVYPDKQSVLFALPILGYQIGVSVESLTLGISIILRAWACVSCFYFITLTTPMNHFFSFLQRCKVSPLLVDLMELIYRFTFLIWDEAKRIHTAQETRLGYQTVKGSLSSLGELVAMLFTNSMNRVERINQSMESRCFSGKFSYLISEEQSENHIVWYAVGTQLLFVAIIVAERVF